MVNKCLSCQSENIGELFVINDAPRNIQALLTKAQTESDKKISLKVLKCYSCELIQLENSDIIDADYYEDYVMTTSFSDSMTLYRQSLAKRFVEDYKLQNKRLFEIGCGDGQFLRFFKDLGVKELGIEPSKAFFDLARKKDLNLLNCYMSDDIPLEENSFDAFVTSAVFEHLKNPSEVLQAAKKVLKIGGIGLIEVPSFEKSLKDMRYYDIFSDHVAYYTKKSLSNLVIRQGFEVIELFSSFNDEFLVIIFKKKEDLPLSEFISGFENYKLSFQKVLSTIISDGKKIVVWGAGGKGIALLSMCGVSNSDVECVVDSDVYKIGKFTLGSHIEIKHPDELLQIKPDVIILTSLAYEEEIKSILKNKYHYGGELFVIYSGLRKVEL